MSFFKDNPYRDEAYRKWVAGLPCAACGIENDTIVGHHLIGVGQGTMGGKASDLDLMPLCYEHHDEIHRAMIAPEIQYKWIAETLQKAIKEGFNFKI